MSLRRLFDRLLHGGDSKLNPSESSLLKIVAEALPSEDGTLLREQVSQIWTVQRPQVGKMTICYYDKKRHPPSFDERGYERCLALIRIKASKGKANKVKMFLHNGCFQSIEGKIPIFPISTKDCEIVYGPRSDPPHRTRLIGLSTDHRHNQTTQRTAGSRSMMSKHHRCRLWSCRSAREIGEILKYSPVKLSGGSDGKEEIYSPERTIPNPPTVSEECIPADCIAAYQPDALRQLN